MSAREHRHAGAREPFGQDLQRHRLAGAGRAGDQPVAVGERKRQDFGLLALADEDRRAVVVGVGVASAADFARSYRLRPCLTLSQPVSPWFWSWFSPWISPLPPSGATSAPIQAPPCPIFAGPIARSIAPDGPAETWNTRPWREPGRSENWPVTGAVPLLQPRLAETEASLPQLRQCPESPAADRMPAARRRWRDRASGTTDRAGSQRHSPRRGRIAGHTGVTGSASSKRGNASPPGCRRSPRSSAAARRAPLLAARRCRRRLARIAHRLRRLPSDATWETPTTPIRRIASMSAHLSSATTTTRAVANLPSTLAQRRHLVAL